MRAWAPSRRLHRDAIESYEKTVASIGTRQKPVLDELYAQESAINRLVGQTPMGMADVVTIDGTTVGVGEIVGWLDGESPEAGNTVYLREQNGEWKAYGGGVLQRPQEGDYLNRKSGRGVGSLVV